MKASAQFVELGGRANDRRGIENIILAVSEIVMVRAIEGEPTCRVILRDKTELVVAGIYYDTLKQILKAS